MKDRGGDQTVVTPAAVCFSGAELPVPLVRQTCSAARTVVARKRILLNTHTHTQNVSNPSFPLNLSLTSPTTTTTTTTTKKKRKTKGKTEKKKAQKDSPLQSPKNNRRRHVATDGAPAQREPVLEHRQRDPAREPEHHGHGVERQDGELVRRGGEEARGEDEVEQGEKGPDGGEEQEVDA